MDKNIYSNKFHSFRSNEAQDEAIKLLDHLNFINKKAKEAVAEGDGTLKEANSTYQTLTGFQTQVQQSSESAKLALETVPAIEKQVRDVEKTVRETEYVIYFYRINFSHLIQFTIFI